MFIRKKRNASGSISVQIIEKVNRRNRLIRTVGSSKDANKIEQLYAQAYRLMSELANQKTFDFHDGHSDIIDSFANSISNNDISVIGPELIFGKLFDDIGFNAISDPLLRDLIITRIVYQGSKLKIVDYLRLYQHTDINVDRIYRFLDRVDEQYKEPIERIAFEHTKKVLGSIAVVFYDMTTLYFEAEDEDDLRRIGFSKDGKFQNPQIMLGLLVGEKGYPIGYEIFEGNTFEGHTLIPVLETFQKKFNLSKPIVVADSGLLSKANIQTLKAKNYRYIIGARIKNETDVIQTKILNLHLYEDGKSAIIKKDNSDRLVVTYTEKRAKKDAYNRKKGLARLEKRISSGRLTKEQINNRGYNKYLTLKGTMEVSIDYDKYEADAKWDGLKGYITNTNLSPEEVIENYSNLWQIEKAFRMSKSDLRIRPIHHRLKHRIEAHICISFAAYTVYKELERLLYQHKAPFGIKYARDLSKSMYGLTYNYPSSREEKRFTLLGMSDEQQLLYDIVFGKLSVG